jgi:hypothetical protein
MYTYETILVSTAILQSPLPPFLNFRPQMNHCVVAKIYMSGIIQHMVVFSVSYSAKLFQIIHAINIPPCC